MIAVLEGVDFASAADFVTQINKARLANKGQWITYHGRVAGHDVRMKTYDAGYLQILDVDGVRHGGAMDLKPTAWKEAIAQAVA